MKHLAVGLMSGTSQDGVSAALCSFEKKRFELLRYQTYSYPPAMAKQISRGQDLSVPEFSRLNMVLGKFFAETTVQFLKKTHSRRSRVAVIGSHGHTIYHGPRDSPKNTLQIGEPSVIAERTGIPVVADFRMRDIAAGGEGAPLIPFFDQYFFGNGPVRALQNIGGIGNISVVGKNIHPVAFDTGPGNGLIDLAAQRVTKGRLHYDNDGRISRRGKINKKAFDRMARHPYFSKKAPKSTGRELFNEKFIPAFLWKDKPANVLATLTYFTAWTIFESWRKFIPHDLTEVIVSGGGALNETLMACLRHVFSPTPVHSISMWNIHPQAKEPAAFAFFALRAFLGKPNHLHLSCGSHCEPLILGKIIPGGMKYSLNTRYERLRRVTTELRKVASR